MTDNFISLPVFPLPVYLLPEGVTRLRVFEPRYLRMVKIALKEQGFIILSKDQTITDLTWGSWVEIINFDKGKDGILEIDVKCKSLVQLLTLKTDTDKLSFAQVKPLTHWSHSKGKQLNNYLAKSLAQAFNTNPLLEQLYSEKALDNPYWVIARWLEILPVSFEIKNIFIISENIEAAKNFVQSIILE